jgi:hypothetical protein
VRKLNLTAQELKALYPPVSDAFDKTVQSTLYKLKNEREQPKVKKKMSAALIFAVILILVTLSAAIALTQSDLLKSMFGSDAQVPEDLQEIVSKPEKTVATADVAVTLDEYLYDGEKLHLSWTVSDISGRRVMVTMSRFDIDGQYVNEDAGTSFQSDDQTQGYVLGGEVDGVAMPVSINNFSTYANLQYGEYPLKSGETVDISCNLYVWDLLNPPVLFSYGSMKSHVDYTKLESPKGLPIERDGTFHPAWLVANEETIQTYTADDYRREYEDHGWAKLVTVQPVKFTIALEPKSVKQMQPTQTTFEMDDFTLVITRMVYMQTGGTLELKVYPKTNKAMNESNPLNRDLVVLNADTMEFLNGGRGLSFSSDQDYLDYQITLEPVSGEMPSSILITPAIMKEKWDWEAEHDLKKDRWYTYILEDTVKVDLQ